MDEIRQPLGSKIQQAKVARLVVGEGGLIRDIQLKGGGSVAVRDKDEVCLAAGAWVEEILRSGITTLLKKLRYVGVCTSHLKLNDRQWEYIRDLPALSFQTKDVNYRFSFPQKH